MQNEKNNQQEEAGLTEAELHFVQSLDQTLSQAMEDGDNVTSIWSRLKPDQRARIAEDYLSRLAVTDALLGTNSEAGTRNPAPPDRNLSDSSGTPSLALDAASIIQHAAHISSDLAAPSERPGENRSDLLNGQPPPQQPHNAQSDAPQPAAPAPATNRYSPPPGYPADFNPLAGFPGLEPSRNGPRPEDIIAGALPGFGNTSGLSPMDVLHGILPTSPESTDLRQPVPGMRDMPQAPDTPTYPPAQDIPSEDAGNTAWPNPTRAHETALDPQTGPAAPNFWPLWIDQQDSLLKQCLKLMSGNMDDAQDALSEAMVKASTKFEDSMDEIRNHRAWLSRIVHNACIDLHRQNRRKAEYREETHGSADTPASPMTAPVIPSPEESFLAGEQLDQLETALMAMQEKLRKPLLMRCVQDRSYDEIAEALGLSNCAVRKRVQLAREHLRGAGIQ